MGLTEALDLPLSFEDGTLSLTKQRTAGSQAIGRLLATLLARCVLRVITKIVTLVLTCSHFGVEGRGRLHHDSSRLLDA